MNFDEVSEAEFDRLLTRELVSRTKLTCPPSVQLQACRDYERQKFGLIGRNAQRRNMGYNLWTDSTRTLRDCHRMLTDNDYRKSTGFTTRTVSRRAISGIAQAIGYRYMRGLEVIEYKLNTDDLEHFQCERTDFRQAFEQAADEAHAINDKGQNPTAALSVVQMFHDELIALCPWLEQVGETSGATALRRACEEAMAIRTTLAC